jgi:hypothetical protein
VSKKNTSLLAAELIAKAKKEGRAAAWDYLEHDGKLDGSENPYDGIEELAEAWNLGYTECENDYHFEKDNPDMYYDEDEDYHQDYVGREW